MLPVDRVKSRKSTLGLRTRSYLGIEPVRLLLPAASVKSKLGRSHKKNDIQKQTPLLQSASLQVGVHNAKKCLFRVNKEKQEKSGTIDHDSYEDISGIDEMGSSDSCHKNNFCVNERDTSKKASSMLKIKKESFCNTSDVNLINRSEDKPSCSTVYMNSDKHHDEGPLLPFPLNRFYHVPGDKFLNKNIDRNLQTKLTLQTNYGSKKLGNICEKATDSTPNYTNLPSHLTVSKIVTDKSTKETNSNENVTHQKLCETQTTCTENEDVNSKEKADDSTLSFTFNELVCASNESKTITEKKLALCSENIRSKSEADSVTECNCNPMCNCNTASLSKSHLPNKPEQTTELMEKQELIIPEECCKCCVNTVKLMEAMVTVIEGTKTCIQSVEKSIVEQLKNSVKQLDIIKHDLTNSIQKNNVCSCKCLRNKMLNVPSNLSPVKSDEKKRLLHELQAKNCSISKSVGAEGSKNFLQSFNKFDESSSSQIKWGEQSINHHILSTSVSYCNTPDISMQASASGNKTFQVKNVTFKIPRRTPVSSRKKNKLYSNYKSHYNMCVKTPESSVKFKRQMNRSLVLTPHSMSNRLSTQIGNLFES